MTEKYLDVSDVGFADISFNEAEDNQLINENKDLQTRLEAEQKKVQLIYEAINKFLSGLKSDPDKTTIKWPTRIKDIEKVQDHLEQLIK